MYAFQSKVTGTIYMIADLGETSYGEIIEAAHKAFHPNRFNMLEKVKVGGFTVALTLDEGTLYQRID